MTRHPNDVAFVMAGDVHRNTRALRQLEALSQTGLSVALLAFQPTTLRTVLPERVDPTYVPRPAGSGPRWFLEVHRRFSRELRAIDAVVYHASDLYVLRAVAGAAARNAARHTYDARELYAHVSATTGRPFVRRFWRAFEAGPARSASIVWTVSDAIADHLSDMHRIPRPTVLLNAPAAGPVAPDPLLRTVTGLAPDVPLFVHLGQMRKGRGGETLVRAFARVPEAGLVFLGYGEARKDLEHLVDSIGAGDRVFFVDPVLPERIRSVISSASVGITLLEDTCLNHRYALPNKLFDYLAAGLPVLASRLPEVDRIVSGQDVGLTVDPTDIPMVAEAVRRMSSDGNATARWIRNARSASETFDWAKASERFTTPLRNLLD